MFIFETNFSQKLMLKVSIPFSNLLSAFKVNLFAEDIRNVLKSKKMKVPPPGSIVDLGIKETIEFLYINLITPPFVLMPLKKILTE